MNIPRQLLEPRLNYDLACISRNARQDDYFSINDLMNRHHIYEDNGVKTIGKLLHIEPYENKQGAEFIISTVKGDRQSFTAEYASKNSVNFYRLYIDNLCSLSSTASDDRKRFIRH